ncbi:MAG: hypothetical protein M3170_06900, partial [Candidatus Dormibacteraeota bacterium]|nr:hypothetical protein [Candidatus Dormibacteraeota bacterium]
ANLVEVRVQGNRRLYRARPESLALLRAFLDELWAQRLGSLAGHAAAEPSAHGEGRRRTRVIRDGMVVHELELRRPATEVFDVFTAPEGRRHQAEAGQGHALCALDLAPPGRRGFPVRTTVPFPRSRDLGPPP